jgi:HSP20 family protein
MMHPFEPFSQLTRTYDQMLRQIDGRRDTEAGKTTAASWAPPVDVVDDGERLLFEVDLPGVPRDKVSIKVEKRVLTIEGERTLQLQPKHEFIRTERAHGPFVRSFRLPESVDADGITAELSDGVLRVSLPQKKEALPRVVEIK